MTEVSEKILKSISVSYQILRYLEKTAEEYGVTLDDIEIDCLKYSSNAEQPSHAYVNFRVLKSYGDVNIDFAIDDGELELYQKKVI